MKQEYNTRSLGAIALMLLIMITSIVATCRIFNKIEKQKEQIELIERYENASTLREAEVTINKIKELSQ